MITRKLHQRASMKISKKLRMSSASLQNISWNLWTSSQVKIKDGLNTMDNLTPPTGQTPPTLNAADENIMGIPPEKPRGKKTVSYLIFAVIAVVAVVVVYFGLNSIKKSPTAPAALTNVPETESVASGT